MKSKFKTSMNNEILLIIRRWITISSFRIKKNIKCCIHINESIGTNLN